MFLGVSLLGTSTSTTTKDLVHYDINALLHQTIYSCAAHQEPGRPEDTYTEGACRRNHQTEKLTMAERIDWADVHYQLMGTKSVSSMRKMHDMSYTTVSSHSSDL